MWVWARIAVCMFHTADAWWRVAGGRYKAWKAAGLSQALDSDLPVSTGAIWGLEKSSWTSQCARPRNV